MTSARLRVTAPAAPLGIAPISAWGAFAVGGNAPTVSTSPSAPRPGVGAERVTFDTSETNPRVYHNFGGTTATYAGRTLRVVLWLRGDGVTSYDLGVNGSGLVEVTPPAAWTRYTIETARPPSSAGPNLFFIWLASADGSGVLDVAEPLATWLGDVEEYVYGDVVLADDALVSRTSLSPDGAVEVGGLTVAVTDASLLGVTAKPLPEGRHRAVVERETSPGVWTAVADGTVSNERTSSSSTYATPASGPHAGAAVRRWMIEVADTALADALDALADVQLEDALDPADGDTIETVRATGAGLEQADVVWYEVHAALTAAATDAGLAVQGPGGGALPPVLPYAAGEVEDDVYLASPHPDRADSAPAWSGAELLDWWRAVQPLVVSAAYAAYPSASVTVTVAPGAATGDYDVAPATAVAAGAADLDDDGAGDRVWEQADWTTEPAAADGAVYDDLAVTWQGGPDGSRVDDAGVVDVPLEATYAAVRKRLTGAAAAARDGGREVGNDHRLEVPARLVGHEADSAATSTATVGGVATDTTTARPVVDVALAEDDVYAIVAVDVAGSLRSVQERVPSGGAATMELWAARLFADVAGRYADRDALRLDAPTAATAGAELGLATVVAEGLVWAPSEIATDHDGDTVALTLVRPTAPAPDPTAVGRYEPAPAVAATATDTTRSDDQGATTYRVDLLYVDASVPASAEAVASWEVEEETSPGTWTARTPVTAELRSALYYEEIEHDVGESPPNEYAGRTYRVRATYPSGTVTAWVEDTVEVS